jgi:hypothetical protein
MPFIRSGKITGENECSQRGKAEALHRMEERKHVCLHIFGLPLYFLVAARGRKSVFANRVVHARTCMIVPKD